MAEAHLLPMQPYDYLAIALADMLLLLVVP